MERRDVSPREAQEGGQGGVDATRPDLMVGNAEQQAVDALTPMPQDGLSNEEISVLCDIGDGKTHDSIPGAAIDKLMAKGYIEPASATQLRSKFPDNREGAAGSLGKRCRAK
jgi:hypothetical protein